METNRFISESFIGFADNVRQNIFIFAGLLLGSLALIFSIFTIIKKKGTGHRSGTLDR